MNFSELTIDRCCITGHIFKGNEAKPITGSIIEYETPYVGHVKVELSLYVQMLNNSSLYPRDILSGISKNRTLNGLEPIVFTSEFVKDGYKSLNVPEVFEEKAFHFLRHLHSTGGKENKEFELRSGVECMIAYATPDEFNRILDFLNDEQFINIGHVTKLAGGSVLYQRVKLTSLGKDQARKGLPKMPLFGLVSQEISTGNLAIDEKINHARTLFFDKPESMDKMRSACETLSHILEPLRDDLETYFSAKDVSTFFQIVNTFDIRHNKDTTKTLQHPEQLEWIFYTLLNTINTYYKIKKRLP
ncbi:hypothetical protein [Pedobacter jejuensis]|uniref:Uncharacterized protein n=1 Tax=Pedobacter jejuensis TaxID=1268550 RepID=A0A3N0BUE5_9SPHI|nr:hypothetical protein [Pedobacter jejuensis]RNL52774.1 hypothetical protein D7004_10800 [Pedobacter jejuensis]